MIGQLLMFGFHQPLWFYHPPQQLSYLSSPSSGGQAVAAAAVESRMHMWCRFCLRLHAPSAPCFWRWEDRRLQDFSGSHPSSASLLHFCCCSMPFSSMPEQRKHFHNTRSSRFGPNNLSIFSHRLTNTKKKKNLHWIKSLQNFNRKCLVD